MVQLVRISFLKRGQGFNRYKFRYRGLTALFAPT